MNINILFTIGGILLIAGGVPLLWSSVREFRRGDRSVRGQIVGAVAMTAYGALALSGIMAGGTAFGAVAVWAVLGLVWTGFYLSFRDRRKARQAR
jgi:hypothetical protein